MAGTQGRSVCTCHVSMELLTSWFWKCFLQDLPRIRLRYLTCGSIYKTGMALDEFQMSIYIYIYMYCIWFELLSTLQMTQIAGCKSRGKYQDHWVQTLWIFHCNVRLLEAKGIVWPDFKLSLAWACLLIKNRAERTIVRVWWRSNATSQLILLMAEILLTSWYGS